MPEVFRVQTCDATRKASYRQKRVQTICGQTLDPRFVVHMDVT
jgi:hypothetical protein